MCGIAGFVDATTDCDPKIAERMANCLRHRGPDDSGVYRGRHVALGHRRLSIIDLAAGHQPMSNEDGTLWLVYNGEIFNHAALRPALEGAGHRYRTRSDSEMILHAYEQYGADCLERFRGMFAFALWDEKNKTLFCARDRLGIKPLYYWWDGRTFVFASEIKALLEHPVVSARFNDAALGEYLAFGYLSGEQTLFAGVRKLMPGHHLTLALGAEPKIECYWDLPVASATEERSEESWIRECRERLEETVRMRLMSDVPLGMFLSGGVDSSAIAALMKRMVSGPVKTFAVGYREAEYSELDYARQVAEKIGTDHHECLLGMEDFFNALPRLIWHEDEPVVWPSSVSLYFVSKLAAEQVKVVLTGEGSDELFAGYARYRLYLLNERWAGRYGQLPAGLRNAVRRWIGASKLLPAAARRKLQHTVLGLGEGVESLYLDNFYSAFRAAGVGAYENFLRYWDRSTPLLSRMLRADQKTYLVELLMKQDQMSMACSIESRVPFLDHPFVEFAARVPDRMKLRGGTGKYILKKAVEDLLPAEIIHRTKMGFPTPLRKWLREPAAAPVYGALRDGGGLLAEYVQRDEIERLIASQQSGHEDATDRIWRLLNLQVWGDVFLNGKRDRWSNGVMPGKVPQPAL